jgi:hypothetical protein
MTQQQIENSSHAIIMKNCVCADYGCQQSICERTACCVSQISDELYNPSTTTYPLNSSYKGSRGRLFQNQTLSFHAILLKFTILVLLLSLSTSRFVTGEQLQHHQHHRDENSYFRNRSNLNRTREEGEQQGNDTVSKHNRSRDTPLAYSQQQQQQGDWTTKKGRELSEESEDALDRFIRQQQNNSDIEEQVPSIGAENFNNSQPPYETNVTSPPSSTQPRLDEPTPPLSFKKGNPLIQSKLPINFRVELLVKDTTTNDLLQELKTTLKNYIQNEYEKLIDRSIENKNTFGISKPAPKSLKLGEVDLNLSLVESKWWQERNRRRLVYNSSSSVRGSMRSRRRDMQEGGQFSNAKLLTIGVDGSVNYSMEVDGSVPTPDDIEKQWSEAYIEITSLNQLHRAIEDADIEGLIRLEQVTTEDGLPADATTVSNGGPGNGSDNGDNNDDENSTTNNESVASLYKNDTDENENDTNENNNKPSGINVEENDNEKNSLDKKSQLERPSLLSIIFGFILTGIAVLGLVVYACIFYRKRKKRLKKKKKMKESITFSSASAAVAAAAAASKRNQNSQYYSKSTQPSASYLGKAPQSSPTNSNSMMVSQSVSEETAYIGLQSSIGSEDMSDPFANELKVAASLDQEAWNESQRIKENVEKRRVTQVFTNPLASKNRNSSIRAPVPSLLSKGPMRLEEEDEIEPDLEGNSSWVKSFPYGDEADNNNESRMPSSSNQWEPYNSVLPPLFEEKKDETTPSEFFAQKLRNIEKDLNLSGVEPADAPRIEANITDDSGSTSDILSEVSELSRYVRRYERRKDRKIKREESLHERLSVVGAPSYLSTPQNRSIGMDGRVNEAHKSNDYDRPTPSSTRRLQSNPLSSYAESFRDAKNHETSVLESMSFVSDDEEITEDTSMRSRLGISPYRRSNDQVYYKNGTLRNEDHSSSNRTRSTRTEDDYRYSMGYSQDHSKSSSSRLADLRANDAIIDNSNSEVNVNYDVSPPPNAAINDNSKPSWSAANKGNGTARPNFSPVNKKKNTEAIISAVNQQQNNISRRPTKNNRFDKMRGVFEQKTNERPEPIYPPGANWQNGGSLGK